MQKKLSRSSFALPVSIAIAGFFIIGAYSLAEALTILPQLPSIPANTCNPNEPVVCPNNKVLSLNNNTGNPGEGTQYAVAIRKPDLGGASIPSIFTIGNNLTYETWIYKVGHNRFGGIFTPAGSADLRQNGSPSFYGSSDGRSLTFRVGTSNDNNQCNKGSCREYTLGQEIPLGKWTHIAVTVENGKTLSWYVNGIRLRQDTLSNWNISQNPRQENIYLGNDRPGASEYPNAKFDEMRIWGITRSASEIKAGMNARLTGTEAGLLHYWNFDASTADLTGHSGTFGNTLDLKNGASVITDPGLEPLKLCKKTCDTCAPLLNQKTFLSDGTEIWSLGDLAGPAKTIAQDRNWASLPDASWISYSATQKPTNGKTYTFTKIITLPDNALPISGLVRYLADDGITDIKINGASVYSGTINKTCNSVHQNWTVPADVALPFGNLLAGNNTLKITVQQNPTCNKPGPFGVTFTGSLSYITAPNDLSCNACVAGGRYVDAPIELTHATPTPPDTHFTCNPGRLPIALTQSNTGPNKGLLIDALCVKTIGVRENSQPLTMSAQAVPEARCPSGQVVVGIDPTFKDILCQKANGLDAAYERTISLTRTSGASQLVYSLNAFDPNALWGLVGFKFTTNNGKTIATNAIVQRISQAPACVGPLPTFDADIRIDRFTKKGNDFLGDPAPADAATLLNEGVSVTTNPALFSKVTLGSHRISVTDKPGIEQFGVCQFSRGSAACVPAASQFTPLPANACTNGFCSIPVSTDANMVTEVVISYAPAGVKPQCSDEIDNDSDNKIDFVPPAGATKDPGCESAQDDSEYDAPLPPPPIVSNHPSCHDGIDNNNDGRVDDQDSRCLGGGNLPETEDFPPAPQASCAFTTNKTVIVKGVDSATLFWSCINGPENASISTIGTVAPNGSRIVSPSQNTTYTLTYGSFTASVTITVTDPIIQEE